MSIRVLDLAGIVRPYVDMDLITEPDGEPVDRIVVGELLSECFLEEIMGTVQGWADMLRDNGELHLWMPSLEWACFEVLGGRMDGHIITHLYGFRDKPRHSILTLEATRDILLRVGLMTVRADTTDFVIGKKPDTGEELIGKRHFLIAVKTPHQPDEMEKRWIPDS